MQSRPSPTPAAREKQPEAKNPGHAGFYVPTEPTLAGVPVPMASAPALGAPLPDREPTPAGAHAAQVAAKGPVTFEQVWRFHQEWCVRERIATSGVKEREGDIKMFLRAAGLTMQSLAGPSLTTGFESICTELQPRGGARPGSRSERERLGRLRDLQRSFEQMVGLRELDHVQVAFTYSVFAQRYEGCLVSEGLAAGTIGNRLRTLRHWRTCFGLGEGEPVGPEWLDPHTFASKRTKFAAWCRDRKAHKDRGQTLSDRDSHVSDLCRAARSLVQVNTEMSVGTALRTVLVASAGTVQAFVEAHPALPRGMVRSYCAGLCRPSREFLVTVERLAQLTPGTLTNLLPTPPRRRAMAHRPNTQAGEVIHRLVGQPYALRRRFFPHALREQLVDFTQHKVGHTGGQGNRPRRRFWRSAQIHGKMTCPTGERFWIEMERFMGWSHHKREIPLSGLDLSLLSRSDLVLGFVDFLAKRRGMVTATVITFLQIPLELLNENWGYVFHTPTLEVGLGLDLGGRETWALSVPLVGGCQGEARPREVAMSLLGGDVKLAPAPGDSCGRHADHWAEHAATPGVARWEKWCQLNRRKIFAGAQELKSRLQIGRPHSERTGSLLALDRPDSALLAVIHRQIEAAPLPQTSLRTRWGHARDSVTLLIAFFGAFRQRQLRECDFVPSRHADENAPWQDRGALQFNAGRYEVWLPVTQFKNASFLKERHPEGYVKREIPARYNGLVKHYLFLRDEVLKIAPLPPAQRQVLLFNLRKNDGTARAMSTGSVTSQVTRTTYAYGGEVLAKGLNPHAIRHVRTTGLIKAGGTIEEAAFLLCDRVETVDRHYKHWMSVDQQRLVATQERMLADCDGKSAKARGSAPR